MNKEWIKKHIPDECQLLCDSVHSLEADNLALKVGIRCPVCSCLLLVFALGAPTVPGDRLSLTLFVFLNMQLNLDVGLEVLCIVFLWRQGNVLSCKELDAQIEVVMRERGLLRGCLADGAITFRLEDIASSIREHSLILHHATIPALPIQGYNLYSGAPEHGRIKIARVDAQALGVYAHEEVLVVFEQSNRIRLVNLHKGFLRQREDVGRYFGFWRIKTLEVVTSEIDTKPGQ
jgi:hypothetical protein